AVGVVFAVTGGLRLAIEFRLRPAAGWGWMLGSGVLSILLALMILFTLPASALGLLGILLGVDLLVAGAVSIGLGLRARQG
ncbi:MAG: HdeD family acid-resistance protein, partial [Paracoccaceae bacterium]